MTNDKTVTMSRELIEEVVAQLDDFITGDILDRLNSALAATVVERQEPVTLPPGVLYITEDRTATIGISCGILTINGACMGDGSYYAPPGSIVMAQATGDPEKFYATISYDLSFTAPPAPVAAGLIVDHKCPLCGDPAGHMGWVCTRQAAPVAVVLPERQSENEGNSYSVMQAMAWNARLDKVKELNQ